VHTATANAGDRDKLPVRQLKLPQGFQIETFVFGLGGCAARCGRDKGTVFVSNRNRDKVYAIAKRAARETKVSASGLDRPNGLAFKDGTRSTSPKAEDFEARKIETISTIHRSRSVIYSDSRTTGRTAGNSWRSDRTTSSM